MGLAGFRLKIPTAASVVFTNPDSKMPLRATVDRLTHTLSIIDLSVSSILWQKKTALFGPSAAFLTIRGEIMQS
jgi:hypothetical protein